MVSASVVVAVVRELGFVVVVLDVADALDGLQGRERSTREDGGEQDAGLRVGKRRCPLLCFSRRRTRK